MKQKFSIDSGVVYGALQVPSPNFNDRPESETVSLLVLHNISLPPGQFGGGYVERFFQNQLPVDEHPYFAEIQDLQVSAHLLIARDGAVTQFVNLNARAWHAGLSQFDGREQCNDFSIGIELEGTDDQPFTDTQYAVLAELTQAIQLAYPAVMSDRIAGHSDIAPGRKTDPGPCFDWQRFRNEIGQEQ
ncbi:1,6-anhydro-N-acetylmuramyl-L-alanine amidase AmpD [Pontibacterium granulatum]|uniref:1,6-anhydro-N-acetylmuramyl-L-alanine amidase AmpD n=1 Tax=Pontibacterium granulatum TaxID=2036029 RepID=UPI00249A21C1|nr:1,6-anhydro-N-acetylmuramyl-L-alanine amidase AmpD [Pontibacterium granulatum]MDI3323617.1 1,6-anhydro-N-acetylmuramyl-L-alanine amidase AmpD [Pontibacterium granulatum]